MSDAPALWARLPRELEWLLRRLDGGGGNPGSETAPERFDSRSRLKVSIPLPVASREAIAESVESAQLDSPAAGGMKAARARSGTLEKAAGLH